ncbi:TVP38/TMEM64 family protein [Bacillus subtilis]|nr:MULTISPECIES: VTT domain-containing protein [Bacillus]MCL0027568.1 VTT domain-containing protein [Bacillus sp. C21]MCL8470858.1 VTT domain-containing protein [Bacillus subtilis]MDI6585534.1 VTT domain-containing protein [Bacillus subtilis]MEC2378886.1 VTT domain-containing protein [Bacillus subtilis]MEC2384006.1 VTT domain-containing protein [Bacillus subtilis]
MKSKFLILALWFLAIYIAKEFHLLSLDMDDLQEFISENTKYAMLLFIALWIIRLLFFIPGVTLMFLGGVCFDPVVSFILSIAGIFLSETLVYVFSRMFSSGNMMKDLERKYPELKKLLETYNYKFLALGMICPIAPTDVVCFLSAAVGIKYTTYILTVIVTNIPLLIFSSFIVINFSESLMGTVLVVASFVLVSIVSIKMWNTLKHKRST